MRRTYVITIRKDQITEKTEIFLRSRNIPLLKISSFFDIFILVDYIIRSEKKKKVVMNEANEMEKKKRVRTLWYVSLYR